MASLFRRVIGKLESYQYQVMRNKWDSYNEKSIVYGKILMFHHISENYVDEIESCQCKTSIFEKILRKYIDDDSITIVSIEEALNIMDSSSIKKFVVITFDDIPDDMFINGYPVLKKYGIPFTVFITTSFIGKSGFVSKEQLEILNQDPLCTIGAHTISHPKVRYCKDAKSEIQTSKSVLETIIGKPVKYFAFPYGRCNSISQKEVIFAKEVYECAFSTIASSINDYTKTKRWFLPRIVEKNI